jgi:hypothetical protein
VGGVAGVLEQAGVAVTLVLDELARVGTWLAACESGSSDPKTKGMQAALRLHYAQALGLPPLAALELSVIRGRLVPSAQLLRALAGEAGLRVVKLEESPESCTAGVVDVRTGELLGRATFTLEMARRAGLLRADSGWSKYPERMLWARASSWAIRDYAPRVALGMTFQDEVEEVTGEPVASFDWDAEPEQDTTIDWPDEDDEDDFDDAPEEPPEAAETPADTVAAPVVDRESTPLTKAQNDKIHAQIRELEFMEQQAGLDGTNWRAFYRGAAGAELDATLTRAQASLAIEALDAERMRLYELGRP